jgi:hypothetical protein
VAILSPTRGNGAVDGFRNAGCRAGQLGFPLLTSIALPEDPQVEHERLEEQYFLEFNSILQFSGHGRRGRNRRETNNFGSPRCSITYFLPGQNCIS